MLIPIQARCMGKNKPSYSAELFWKKIIRTGCSGTIRLNPLSVWGKIRLVTVRLRKNKTCPYSINMLGKDKTYPCWTMVFGGK